MKIIIVASSPVKTFYQNYHLNPSDYFIGIDAGSLELIKRGIKRGIMLFIFCIKLPVSKLVPLAACAFIILSVSSIKVGINLRAIVIIIAISCTGNFTYVSGFSRDSNALVSASGDVVSVSNAVNKISRTSLITTNAA